MEYSLHDWDGLTVGQLIEELQCHRDGAIVSLKSEPVIGYAGRPVPDRQFFKIIE